MSKKLELLSLELSPFEPKALDFYFDEGISLNLSPPEKPVELFRDRNNKEEEKHSRWVWAKTFNKRVFHFLLLYMGAEENKIK